jgi:hypothetical protein
VKSFPPSNLKVPANRGIMRLAGIEPAGYSRQRNRLTSGRTFSSGQEAKEGSDLPRTTPPSVSATVIRDAPPSKAQT